MPLTVITLRKVPISLRGDLTKWMQEIDTGVYVGNFNSRIREYLWERVCNMVGSGEATMSYSCRNEIGYNFVTINTARKVIDYDGIPLVIQPGTRHQDTELKKGFSSAYKMRRARRSVMSKSGNVASEGKIPVKQSERDEIPDVYVCIDIETTGLDPEKNEILEIGAVRHEGEKNTYFQQLIRTESKIPEKVKKLTGITNQMAEAGENLKETLQRFLAFIGDAPLVGYNVHFDVEFLTAAMNRCGIQGLANPLYDLIKIVRKEQIFQTDYKLSTSLRSYGINKEVPHRALDDAKLIYELSRKVKKFS